jgi:pyrimidine-nucleoside phosphorylase
MRIYDIILNKRNGQALSAEEIDFLIKGYMSGAVPDYQMTAFLMAVFFRGMNSTETGALTMAMVNSGEIVDLSAINGIKVDKHSTGGVGDKTTLILGPLVAAAGVPVAKMSGRGLGHTGGTIDKLEAIPGFKTALTKDEFIASVNRINIAIGGQTGNLAPADKKMYALRDVTATVDSIPLIASSVMSKKIAAGADAIVLDVKVGSGAFMKKLDDAVTLAKAMVSIGTNLGRETVALITDMDQPLGKCVGNSLEVFEAVECLNNRGPEDLRELCLALGAQMVYLAGKADSTDEARTILEKLIAGGQALTKFKELVVNQNGDVNVIENPDRLITVKHTIAVNANKHGFVTGIYAEKIGDKVNKGEVLATLYCNNMEKVQIAEKILLNSYTINNNPPLPRKLIFGQIDKNG